MVKPGKKQKNPPVMSQEFIIQNHADIVSCIAMVFVGGLLMKTTSPLASMFITMHHNITSNNSEQAEDEEVFYTSGIKDIFAVFFYLLICIVVHAVIQEYILDKINRKLHLSKTKHSKFNESGQLLVFYTLAAVWGADLFVREDFFPSISRIWTGYPHAMSFRLKFYFIIQIAYWLHLLPELYLQKVKREEIQGRVRYIALYMSFISAAYILNFHRVALLLIILHYLVEAVFHAARIFYFADKMHLANPLFLLWNISFIAVRLMTVILGFLTFWSGLEKERQTSMDVAKRNFNTSFFRVTCLAALVLLQGWLMWNFITFQVRRARERAAAVPQPPKKKTHKPKRSKAKESDGDSDSDAADENGSVRQRKSPRAHRRTNQK